MAGASGSPEEIDYSVVDGTASRGAVPPPPPVAVDDARNDYDWSTIAVDMLGSRTGGGELSRIKPLTYLEELNGVGAYSFEVGLANEALSVVFPNGPGDLIVRKEVQLWRDDDLEWWGIPTRLQIDGVNGKGTITCQGIPWYLGKRFFGEAITQNVLQHGDFDDGDPVFEAFGSTNAWLKARGLQFLDYQALGAADAVIDDTHLHEGAHSLKVTQPGDIIAGEGIAVWQNVLPTVFGGRTGVEVTFSIWAFIPAATYLGPNPEQERGIGIAALRPDWFANGFAGPYNGRNYYDGGQDDPGNFTNTPINNDTPKDAWIHLSASLTVAAGQTKQIAPTMFSCKGITWYADAELIVERKLEFVNTDQVDIGKGLVAYAQGHGLPAGTSTLKTDLNVGTAGARSGVKHQRTYSLLSNQPVGGQGGALDEFASFDDGFDWGMTYTPTRRTMNFYYPQKGVLHNDYLLQYKRGREGGEVLKYECTYDGENAANAIIVLGQALGTGHEQGQAFEPDFTSLGGVELEDVEPAPVDVTSQAELNRRARHILALRKALDPIMVFTVQDREHRFFSNPTSETAAGRVRTGDIVYASIDDGWLQVPPTQVRVIAIEYDFPSGTLKLTVTTQIGR